MPFHAKNKRFTIYDAMEAAGEFAKNPANREAMNEDGSSAYVKQEFPKMLYHPKGEERILFAGKKELVNGEMVKVGEVRELIHKLVHNEQELEAALAEGWHRRPGDANSARTGEAPPPASAAERIEELEKLLAKEKEKGALTAAEAAGAKIVAKNGETIKTVAAAK